MLGLFLLFKASQVSDNIDATHKRNEREKAARIKANPVSGEALAEASKEMALSLWFCTCLVTMGIMAIGHGTFWGSFFTVPCMIASAAGAIVGAVLGPLVALGSQE